MTDSESMSRPKLACCNFIPDVNVLRDFALDHGFDGIDWSFTPENLPVTRAEESALAEAIASLHPLEVRYHCAFKRTDPGDVDAEKAVEAMKLFRHVCRIVSGLGGRVMTIHVGLGRDTTHHLSWERTVKGLSSLVDFARSLGIRLCLENLAWGWTCRPELFEKLVRKSGAWATLDIGHARVSPYVMTQHYQVEDFVAPQPERFLNAHIYHEEEGDTHQPPRDVADIRDRLDLLRQMTSCQWWVLELREEEPLLQTLDVVRQFLLNGFRSDPADAAQHVAL
jgi:hypothetical protein